MSEPMEKVAEPFPELPAETGEIASNSASIRPLPPVRRHRRTRQSVRSEEIEDFRAGYFGESATPELERAFGQAKMSLVGNNATGNANSNNAGPAPLANFFENNNNSANATGMGPVSRPSSTSSTPRAATPTGGNGGPAEMGAPGPVMPQNAGQPMDLNHLYAMVLELSDVLKNNREMTRGIVHGAEELMRRSVDEGQLPTVQDANSAIQAARIADLERQLAKEKRRVEHYQHENKENWKLIHEYEDTVAKMVELVRNYCCNNEGHYLALKRQYNDLLQAERDAHLQTRLECDEWNAKTLRCSEMIRTAYRLRCEEEELPIRVVGGLQNEVRMLRDIIGLEHERPQDEWGWPILRDAPRGIDESRS